jgi:hypothetical protein
MSPLSFHVPVVEESVDPSVVVVPAVAEIAGAMEFVGAATTIVDCQVVDAVAVLPARS